MGALLWSDPEDIVYMWGLNPCGAGFLFGGSVVTSFNRTNDIDYICRAHHLRFSLPESFLSALVENQILQFMIRAVDRKQEVPQEGPMCDLLWSDPEDNVDTWGLSPHGAGFLFGGSVVTSFNHTNDIDYICRAHQLVMDGCGNVAAILELYAYLNQQFRVFEATPQIKFSDLVVTL
ncbi:serine/threonine-protein phosphatase PP-X isozyme 2 [Tanacetum coccineum]